MARGESTAECEEAVQVTPRGRARTHGRESESLPRRSQVGWRELVKSERTRWLDASALDAVFDDPDGSLEQIELYLRPSGAPGLLFEQQEQAVRRAGELVEREIMSRLEGHASALRRMRERERARYQAAREREERLFQEWQTERSKRLTRMLRTHGIQASARELADPQRALAISSICDDQAPGLWGELDTRLERAMASSPQQLALAAAEQRLETARERVRAAESDWWRALRENALDVLRELRGFGGELEQHPFGAEALDASVALTEAARFLPSDWLRASNRHHEDGRAHRLLSLSSDGRSSYRHRGEDERGEPCGIISLSTRRRGRVTDEPGGVGTAAHELAHRFEHVLPALKALQWTFYNRRTRGGSLDGELEPSQPLSNFYPDCYPEERTREDRFVRPYIGRVRGEDTIGSSPSESFEVLALALEDLVSGRIGVIERDPDMRRFLWGVLALV